MNVAEFQLHAEKLARLLVCIAVFFIPFSHFMVEKSLVFAVLLSIVSNRWQEKWPLLKNQKALWWGGALVLLFLCSVFYGQALYSDALQWFFKYTKILYIPILLPLFLSAKSRTQVLNCFIAGMTMALLIAYAHTFGLHATMLGADGVFINIIDFSVLSAFLGYLLLTRMAEKKYLYLYGILLGVLLFHLYFINSERSGCFIFMLLAVFFFWRRYGIKALVTGLIMLPLFTVAVYAASPKFQNKIHNVYGDLKAYEQNHVETSLGLRLSFWNYSMQIIKQHPYLGVGVGAFSMAYQKTGGPTLPGNTLLGEPHSEYIFIFAQLGVLGLLLFIGWIATLWRDTRFLMPTEKSLAQALLITFAIFSLINATLTLTPLGNFIIVFIAVLFAAQLRGSYENRTYS